MPPKRLNQAAIARATGVSRATVSLVLRGGSGSSSATKAKVLAAAQQMGYRPNALVHSIRSGKSRTIGVLVQPYDSYWKGICHGIHDRLVEADYLPLFLWQDVAVADEGHALRQVHRLLDRRVDGVILWPRFAALYADHLQEFKKRDIPLVSIDHFPPRLKADTISSKEADIAALIARRLLKLGHRTFLLLNAPKGVGWADRRSAALRQELARGGRVHVAEVRASFEDDAAKKAAKALAQTPAITAAIGCSDRLAADLYQAAARLQWKIPDRLSVMGVGGLDFAPLLAPPLATITQDGYALGRKAAETVLFRCNGRVSGSPRHHELPVRLTEGGSIAPVKPARTPAGPSSARG